MLRTSKSTLLAKKSNKAMGVIFKLIDSLRKTNESIDSEKQANVERIAAINAEQAALSALSESNSKIIAKFEGMLG